LAEHFANDLWTLIQLARTRVCRQKAAIFQLTFPEEFIKLTVITATNIEIKGEPLTLQEFIYG
jgi:hypothetical protein